VDAAVQSQDVKALARRLQRSLVLAVPVNHVRQRRCHQSKRSL